MIFVDFLYDVFSLSIKITMLFPSFHHIVYTRCAKPLFFLINPEIMHSVFWWIGHILGKWKVTRRIIRVCFQYTHPALTQNICWINFSNPVWLAAGFDKDIQLCHIISDVGFGHAEVWSITAAPYKGNPSPRLYRLKKSQWLIVYYGLKNKWVHRAIQKLKSYKHIHIPIVISLAKTNCQHTTDPIAGKNDYLLSLDACIDAQIGDIYELNISCPNAFWWEDFAHPEYLRALLDEVRQRDINKPLFVKMPVDISREDLQPLLDICLHYHIAGVVMSNLTKQREELIEKDTVTHIHWWISGKPTRQKSNALIWKTYQYCGDKICIIGVWGIFSAHDAYEKIKQWAHLVQLITGMIFQWPQLIWQINKGIVELLHQDWYTHISQAVWAHHRL